MKKYVVGDLFTKGMAMAMGPWPLLPEDSVIDASCKMQIRKTAILVGVPVKKDNRSDVAVFRLRIYKITS